MSETKIQNKTNEIKTTNAGLSVRSLDDLPESVLSENAEHLYILGDTSGSMDTWYSEQKTRLQGLQEALVSLWEITDWSACLPKCHMFSDSTREISFTIDTQPEVVKAPAGGTSFVSALEPALKDQKTTRIILCSDGEANKPTIQIEQCQTRGIPIDTIYIGTNEEDRGAILLKEISDETGGVFCLCKNTSELVQQFQQLETHNRLALEYNPGEDENGPIQL